MLTLDHLAISAETLEAGRDAVETALGVTLQPGGEHVHFGTHNMLLGLEDGLYLEVIAINPTAPPPEQTRWFDLDRFHGTPRLSNWICRVDDLQNAVTQFPNAGLPVPLARGDLRWQMAVPADGILPYDNLFPALMQWQCDKHPAQMLTTAPCRLRKLIISHPQALQLDSALVAHLTDKRVVFETGSKGMRAEFETPDGLRVLS